MSFDISSILAAWEHDNSKNIQARLFAGADGKQRLQLRIEMGLLQMELRGRPDGEHPEGFESLLDYHKHRLLAHRMRHSTTQGFNLNHDECIDLQRESLQFYHRRISLLELGMYDLAEEDANHNLQILDLLKDYAEQQEDWLASEQYRPFILSHRAMARALSRATSGDVGSAVAAVDEGIASIERVLRDHGQDEQIDDSAEIQFLENLKTQIRKGRTPVDPAIIEKPANQKQVLERELRHAVEREDYERAAEIRDELNQLAKEKDGGD